MASPLIGWTAACGCTCHYSYDPSVPADERVHVCVEDPRNVWCSRHRQIAPADLYPVLQAESIAEQAARQADEADQAAERQAAPTGPS